jgi:hypothetical protein
MTVLTSFEPGIALALVFFGVLVFSLATAVIALLADY